MACAQCLVCSIAAIQRCSVVDLLARDSEDVNEQLAQKADFTELHCLYTGASGPLDELRSWVAENNTLAVSGVPLLMAQVKCIWKLHEEVFQ